MGVQSDDFDLRCCAHAAQPHPLATHLALVGGGLSGLERLLWQRAQLTVDKYPESELTLTVFTLSMDKHWLEL